MQILFNSYRVFTSNIVVHFRKVKIEGEEIRLVDDGFAKICNMVNDVSMQVRRESASLLVRVCKSFFCSPIILSIFFF